MGYRSLFAETEPLLLDYSASLPMLKFTKVESAQRVLSLVFRGVIYLSVHSISNVLVHSVSADGKRVKATANLTNPLCFFPVPMTPVVWCGSYYEAEFVLEEDGEWRCFKLKQSGAYNTSLLFI